jgi:adenine-specific DNA-methyltransferase
VIVLGWNVPAAAGRDVAALNDPNLEVRVIPPDLLDRLNRKGQSGPVRFAGLRHLDARVVWRKATGDGEELRVELVNYVLLSPDAVETDDGGRAALRAVSESEPLALIEYWAVDPDYDGEVFRAVWRDYRGTAEKESGRVVPSAQIRLPRRPGARRVCVRAADVFGFESEVVSDVPEAAQ